jgi:hypothetical protein
MKLGDDDKPLADFTAGELRAALTRRLVPSGLVTPTVSNEDVLAAMGQLLQMMEEIGATTYAELEATVTPRNIAAGPISQTAVRATDDGGNAD